MAAHRTSANRLGVAVQLCFLRHPGRAWAPEETMPAAMLRFIAQRVGAEPADLPGYAERDQTRREHAVEVMREYDFAAFSVKDYRTLSPWLTEQARGTDNGLALVTMLTAEIRRRRIVTPSFPEACRFVLETLREVYGYDDQARGMSAGERFQLWIFPGLAHSVILTEALPHLPRVISNRKSQPQ